jgi:hypothetical protein
MAGNIPSSGGSVLPGTYTLVQTISSGASVPGGIRVTSIIGQGAAAQTIVAAAIGGGQDGLDPTFTTPNGADGRHFLIAQFPVVQHQSTFYINGIPLVGVENVPLAADSVFLNQVQYQYQFDYTTGQLELQGAYIENQGGSLFVAGSNNVGVGTINGLTLVDDDAPAETWTIKCVGVQRNALNQPIAGTAQFSAIGTVSGNVLDANGNPVLWIANNTTTTNTILSFAIQETNGVPFRQGDSFTIIVDSGMLNRGDTLTATFIPVGNLNTPTFLTTMPQISAAFGAASVSNNLTLGCQLAFANSAPGIMCVQAAPPLPIRTSFDLSSSVNSMSSDEDDFIFPLPLGVVPDLNQPIHFFVTNPSTSVETQILPNLFPFYTLVGDESGEEAGVPGQPTVNQFVFDNVQAPNGNSFSYSVIQNYESLLTGFDGYITADTRFGLSSHGGYLYGIFNVSTPLSEVQVPLGSVLRIVDSDDAANVGYWIVNAIADGKLYIQLLENLTNYPTQSLLIPVTNATVFPDFITSGEYPPGVPHQAPWVPETDPETFELIDPSTGLPVTGSGGTDGILVALLSTGTATLTSSEVDFASFGVSGSSPSHPAYYQLQLNGSQYNSGTYNITGYNSGSNSITIAKTVATDYDMRFQVLDVSVTASNYIVVNHNVIPNGNALRVDLVDARDANFFDAGWINALASLETQEIDILVPLPNQTISVIFQNARNHVISQSSIVNKHERVLFIGAINGLTPSNLTGATLAAVESIGVLEGIHGNTVAEVLAGDTEDLANYSVPDAFGFGTMAYRTVYFYPDQIVVQAGASNILIDGFYIAAAAGGYMSGQNNIAMPLTNKVLSGFSILANKTFSTTVLLQLAAAGVTTLQPVQGGGNVVWGITTSQSGFIEEQEISIVFIRDKIAKSFRAGFAGFIGLPEDDSTQSKLTGQALAMLNAFISQGLITAFQDLTIMRDTVDPRQWDITVAVQPVYPTNYVFITVNIGNLGVTS